jgi:hypothetical protein
MDKFPGKIWLAPRNSSDGNLRGRHHRENIKIIKNVVLVVDVVGFKLLCVSTAVSTKDNVDACSICSRRVRGVAACACLAGV